MIVSIMSVKRPAVQTVIAFLGNLFVTLLMVASVDRADLIPVTAKPARFYHTVSTAFAVRAQRTVNAQLNIIKEPALTTTVSTAGLTWTVLMIYIPSAPVTINVGNVSLMNTVQVLF